MLINETFKNLIPPLSQEEFNQLEANILKDGCMHPLVLWNDTLIDGHNRYAICTKHNIAFTTVSMDFADESTAKLWMLNLQLGRRNLSSFVKAELALQMKPLIAAEAKKNQGTRKDITGENVKSVKTDKQLAKLSDMSHDTIRRVEFILKNANDTQIAKLRSGSVSINKIFNEITNRSNKDKWLAKARLDFKPSAKQPCVVCDKYAIVAEAHHLYPLARLLYQDYFYSLTYVVQTIKLITVHYLGETK